MKVWSDGISGMCTFTCDGKTASAYCRMWTRDTTLRVSVVVGGGFQSLDESVDPLFVSWKPADFAPREKMVRAYVQAACGCPY